VYTTQPVSAQEERHVPVGNPSELVFGRDVEHVKDISGVVRMRTQDGQVLLGRVSIAHIGTRGYPLCSANRWYFVLIITLGPYSAYAKP
jgi:hypothetical protein